MYKLGLEKAEGPETKLPTFVGSWEKRVLGKTSTSSLIKLKLLTVWITTKCRKTLKEMGIPYYLTCLPRKLFVCQEATVKTRYVSNLGKEYDKVVYCHLGSITSMQSTS